MNEVEIQVQKYLVTFVKFLPNFVEKWKDLLTEVSRPLLGLVNQSEQMRSVESVVLKDVDDFKEMQERLLFKIYEGIEGEIAIVKSVIEKLNNLNSDLKNKLNLLENASINLDWEDQNSFLIKGSATQPAIGRLLEYALDFWLFFRAAAFNINAKFRAMNARDANSMNELENSFKVDLEDRTVRRFVAITQYVDNEKAIL